MKFKFFNKNSIFIVTSHQFFIIRGDQFEKSRFWDQKWLATRPVKVSLKKTRASFYTSQSAIIR